MLVSRAKLSGGPWACPDCGGLLRSDVYVDERVDHVCEGCDRVVAIQGPGLGMPVLKRYEAPRA